MLYQLSTIRKFFFIGLMTSVLIGGLFVLNSLPLYAAWIAPPIPPGPPPPPSNQDPSITDAQQYKSDGLEVLTESAMTAGDKVVFAITMSDPDDDQVRFRIELCPKDDPFTINCGLTGTIIESDFFPSGTQLKATSTTLTEGKYKWRMKVFDDQGGESGWQEFGDPGNTDFEVNFVPLYTQNESDYPSFTATRSWADLEYASGYSQTYYCGSKIRQCGCAMTSAVMTLRYHNIFDNIDGDNVDPLIMNAWLRNTTTTSTADVIGYYNGNVNWKAIEKFAKTSIDALGSRIVFVGRIDGTPSNTKVKQTLNNDLESYQPVIIRNNPAGHFLLATEKLASTYLVNDPFWYNTQTLNHNLTAEDRTKPYNNYKHDYNNFYNGLRRFAPPLNCKPYPCVFNVIDLTLASPAELVVIDPLGRMLGKNPLTGVEYNQIPDATYTQEGIGNPDNPGPSPHQLKSIWIPDALNGQYQVKVIGTDNGEYTLFSTMSDAQNDTQYEKHTGHTQNEYEAVYIIDFDKTNIQQTQVEPQDTTPPTTTIQLNGQPGKDDWYTSDIEVSLTAQDNPGGSGVYQTQYSLDNGQTWQDYTSPLMFTQEGTHTLLYRSEDFVGNLEEIQTHTIKIDKTPPEAEIFFDPDSQKLVIQGQEEQIVVTRETLADSLGLAGSSLQLEPNCCNQEPVNSNFLPYFPPANALSASDWRAGSGNGAVNFSGPNLKAGQKFYRRIVYTLEDQAGHTLKLFFKQPKIQIKILTRLEKIQYNDNQPIKINKHLHYFWTTSWFNKSIKSLTQSIGRLRDEWINAIYNKRLGKTIITIKENGTNRQTLPDLVIIKLYTQQDNLNYSYENK